MTAAWTGDDGPAPCRGPAIPAPSRPLRRGTVTRALAVVRRVPVVQVLTSGPVLRASAYAVVSAVVGGVVRRLATAGRPARPEPVSRARAAPAAGAEVRVSWTVVDVRWTVR